MQWHGGGFHRMHISICGRPELQSLNPAVHTAAYLINHLYEHGIMVSVKIQVTPSDKSWVFHYGCHSLEYWKATFVSGELAK